MHVTLSSLCLIAGYCPALVLQHLIHVDIYLRSGVDQHQFNDFFVGEKVIRSDALNYRYKALVHSQLIEFHAIVCGPVLVYGLDTCK